MSGFLADLLTPIDSAVSLVLAGPVRLLLWGAVGGVSSMLLYRLASPQERLQELSREAADALRALNAHQGAFADALPLMRASLALSLRRLRAALLPSLLAGLPVGVILWGLGRRYAEVSIIPWGPGWVQSWQAGFFLMCGVSALAAKVLLRIK